MTCARSFSAALGAMSKCNFSVFRDSASLGSDGFVLRITELNLSAGAK